MENFNLEMTEKDFYKGKLNLDSGRYVEALAIYDNLISGNEKFAGDKDADLLLETSLNNRGVAKCKLGLISRDKDMYKSGMSDFEKSIHIDNPNSEAEKKHLTAFLNLTFSEKEIQCFDKEEKENFNFDNFLSI